MSRYARVSSRGRWQDPEAEKRPLPEFPDHLCASIVGPSPVAQRQWAEASSLHQKNELLFNAIADLMSRHTDNTLEASRRALQREVPRHIEIDGCMQLSTPAETYTWLIKRYSQLEGDSTFSSTGEWATNRRRVPGWQPQWGDRPQLCQDVLRGMSEYVVRPNPGAAANVFNMCTTFFFQVVEGNYPPLFRDILRCLQSAATTQSLQLHDDILQFIAWANELYLRVCEPIKSERTDFLGFQRGYRSGKSFDQNDIKGLSVEDYRRFITGMLMLIKTLYQCATGVFGTSLQNDCFEAMETNRYAFDVPARRVHKLQWDPTLPFGKQKSVPRNAELVQILQEFGRLLVSMLKDSLQTTEYHY